MIRAVVTVRGQPRSEPDARVPEVGARGSSSGFHWPELPGLTIEIESAEV
jgi:hypothetical protein